MANMSYCRFQNTLKDLQDCYENIEDDIFINESDAEDLTFNENQEIKARLRLIDLCKSIAEDYM
jgi:hypothetical protein